MKNTNADYDNDGNNIVPCPLCSGSKCPSKDGGKCPEEDEFGKSLEQFSSGSKCCKCGGNGWYADHAPMSTHNPEDGSCMACPVQVPCDACRGSGTITDEYDQHEAAVGAAMDAGLTEDEAELAVDEMLEDL